MNSRYRANPVKETAIIVGIFIVYFLSGKLGLKLAFENASATAVWPPTGIAIAAFLLRGYHIFPAILAGAFFINITTTGDIITSILIAIGNTSEGLLGAWLVNKYSEGLNTFASSSNILKFVFLAGILSTLVSATIGVTSLALWDFVKWDNYASVWLTWWIGDAVGAFLIAPLIVLWFKNEIVHLQKPSAAESAAVVLALLFVSYFEFSPLSVSAVKNYPLSFLLIPPFVWISFRFKKRYVITAAFLVSVVAIWSTLHGYGPFSTSNTNISLVFLQSFISLIIILSLVFAAIVDERNANEEKLRQAYSSMEVKVFERTQELKKAEEELIHSEKLASLGRFSAGIAHEIRNPLANISSLAQLLKRKNSNDEISQHLDFIIDNSEIANNIIKDLLNFASRDTASLKETDLTQLLEKVCNGVEARCEKNKIRIIKNIQPGLPNIKANEDKLHTAFLNLISNAIDAMPGGGTLRVTAEHEPSGETVVTFEDSGSGIPRENISKVLEPFFTTKPDGTGLGLALAYQVVNLHSGRIEIKSEVNEGTSFIIKLPSVQN